MPDTSPRTGVGLREAWLRANSSPLPNNGHRSHSRMVPPMLYLPVREDEDGSRTAEVRATQDGRRALLAYTALDRLALACGELQPWTLVPLSALEDLQAEQPFDLVAFDPDIPTNLLHGGRLA